MPAFPNVPDVPGVPPLLRDPFAVIPVIPLLARDLLTSLVGILGGPQWGIFFNGVPVVIAESVVTLDYKKTWNLPTYPIEGGSFETYDKVEQPFQIPIRFASAGTELSRQALLVSAQTVAASLGLFDVATPEVIYTNVNISMISYRRAAQSGVGMISIDMMCSQIRATATALFTNTLAPSGAGEIAGGTVNPVDATSSQEAALADCQ